MDFIFINLEDNEFFKRYSDGVPVYNKTKQIINTYALVFIDGPHTYDLVLDDFNFFKKKIPIGGVIVFDDIYQYPHMEKLDNYIQLNGYKILEQGDVKISYIKI